MEGRQDATTWKRFLRRDQHVMLTIVASIISESLDHLDEGSVPFITTHSVHVSYYISRTDFNSLDIGLI